MAGAGRCVGILAVLGLVLAALSAGPTAAQARIAYVALGGTNEVVAFDTESRTVLGDPIPVDEGSGELALTPDGRFAVVARQFENSVFLIDTRARAVVDPPIGVSYESGAVAVSPDGRYAHVSSGSAFDAGAVTTIDLATRKSIGESIELGHRPGKIAVLPDGRDAFVPLYEHETVLVVDLIDRRVVGKPIKVGSWPVALAVTPDGSRVYVANMGEGEQPSSVSAIDVDSRQVVGPPIAVGHGPREIAISPDGRLAYVANYGSESLSVIDTQLNQVIDEIPVGGHPAGVTFAPDGRLAYVSSDYPTQVEVIDTQAGTVSGPIEMTGGGSVGDVVVTPNQGPVASFTSSAFYLGLGWLDGSASSDPEGQPLRYEWSFGDGQGSGGDRSALGHRYASPGNYAVNLTVADNEGCSTAVIFTGQTAYCNGSPLASRTQEVRVDAPARGPVEPTIRLGCPAKAEHRCKYRFRVVATRKRKSRALSVVTRVGIKPGAARLVSLQPRPLFVNTLATADSVLIRGVRFIGSSRVRFLRERPVIR